MSQHRPKYRVETIQGRAAALKGLPATACPYGMSQIGARMAWLAGWADAMNEWKTTAEGQQR